MKPGRQDWTEAVRQDLADFGMSADPELLKKYSKYSFKKVVKDKATEFTFNNLMKIKEKHSKLSALSYYELRAQTYFSLPGTNISEIRTTFLFRVRMPNFFDNFRAGSQNNRLCQICQLHNDDQNMITECKVMKDNFKGSLHEEVKNIYSQNIVISSAKNIFKAIKLRDSLIMKKVEN